MSNDITELTPEKLAEIRQRYSPVAAPKCHICGAEMTIGAISASRIVYACSGATYGDAGCHYAPGRSIADDHYAQSRVTVVDVSDPDVLALVEALEKAQHDAAVDWEAAASMNVENQELKQRIAELERSEAQLIEERDNTESALADMYHAATGERPEWSNMFQFSDAVEEVEQNVDSWISRTQLAEGRIAELEAQSAQSCEHSMFWDASGVKRCSKCDRADLESRTVTVKLPKRSVAEVMLLSGFDRQYAEGWCSGNDNAIHEMRTAGIQVIEGEGQ